MVFPILLVDLMRIQNYMKHIIILAVVCLLAGCKESMNYSYLMLHPNMLHQAYAACEEASFQGQDCDLVKKAGENFAALVDQRREDPELFGHKILLAQQTVSLMADHLSETQQQLSAKPQDPTLQEQVKTMQKTYEDQQLQVKVLLAVVRSTSFGDG